MRGKKRAWFQRRLGVLSLSALLVALPLAAQSVHAATGQSVGLYNQGTQPYNPAIVPLMAEIIRGGGSIYYMGERSGLTGWLVVKGGQIQMIYVAPDRHTLFIGVMLTDSGDPITSIQVAQLADTNKDVAAILRPAAVQQSNAMVAGAVAGGTASLPADYEKTQTLGNILPAITLSPGERLIMDLRAAAGVANGPSGKPELYMLVDTKCTGCSDIWKDLKDPVQEGKIQVHLIPATVGVASKEDVRVMAMLLQVKNPFDVWEKYIGGDAAALGGTPDGVHVRAVGANRAMMDRWQIQAVPYLVYRAAKDHEIKIVQGKPNRMASILAGLLGQ